MKKQQGSLKATELQERLINREAFHLVNPRKYGTASARTERQLVKKMKSLNTQQDRRMAKIEDEIDEVKAHQKKLREVDDTTWDPRTVIEKSTDTDDVESRDEVEKGKQGDASFGVETRVRKHLALGRQDTSNRSLTSVVAWDCPKSMTPYVSKSRKHEPNGYLSKSVRQERGLNYLKTTTAVSSMQSPKNSFQCGLLDIRLKRDANLSKHYNYNLLSADKVAREKRRQNTRHVSHVKREPEPESSRDTRENNLLTKSQGAKKNLHKLRSDVRRHVEFVSGAGAEQDASNHHGHIHVATTHKLASHEAIDHKGVGNHAHKKTHFLEHGISKNGAEHRQYSSDDEVEKREESTPEPSEENWGETLRKCRYLRKPRGYETPEIALEAVFQYE